MNLKRCHLGKKQQDCLLEFFVGEMTSRTAADAVYAVVKSVFENFDAFSTLHPAFKNLKKSGMIKKGLSVPLHHGALRYYREAGLL